MSSMQARAAAEALMLPPKIPKPAKRSSRWRSQAHLRFVRSHVCTWCYSPTAIEAAHVRNGSGAGLSRKPDDWRAVSLCKECHQHQHTLGEKTFWERRDVEAIIDAFCKASPKRAEIEKVKREREDG